jgi:hypothetical protein
VPHPLQPHRKGWDEQLLVSHQAVAFVAVVVAVPVPVPVAVARYSIHRALVMGGMTKAQPSTTHLPLPSFQNQLSCHPERSGSRHFVSHAVEGPAVALALACFSHPSQRTQAKEPKTKEPSFRPKLLTPL